MKRIIICTIKLSGSDTERQTISWDPNDLHLYGSAMEEPIDVPECLTHDAALETCRALWGGAAWDPQWMVYQAVEQDDDGFVLTTTTRLEAARAALQDCWYHLTPAERGRTDLFIDGRLVWAETPHLAETGGIDAYLTETCEPGDPDFFETFTAPDRRGSAEPEPLTSDQDVLDIARALMSGGWTGDDEDAFREENASKDADEALTDDDITRVFDEIRSEEARA